MENQINMGDQNTQQIGQNPLGQPAQVQEKVRLNYLVIGLVVLACFVVFGLGGYYLGKRTQNVIPVVTIMPTPTPSSIPTRLPASTGNEKLNEPVGSENSMEADGEYVGFIKRVYEKNNKNYLDINYIQWLTDVENGVTTLTASKACVEDGNCSKEWCHVDEGLPCMPNGYYIRNKNLQIRTFEIADSVVIDFSDFKNAGLAWKDNQQLTSANLSFNEFQSIFSGKESSINWLKDAVYRIEISKNIITKIRYQYQP